MAFQALYTQNLGLPYFAQGGVYSAEADRRRFFYLDYNLESFVGIIGGGIIEGFEITPSNSLTVKIGYGTAILSDFFSESPFRVKERSTILPSDIVISTDYYVETTGGTVIEVEDPDLETVPAATLTTVHYDKVLYQPEITLLDNADNYLYIYRNSNALIVTPYYAPNVVSPTPEVASDRKPLYTGTDYGVTGSQGYAQGSGRGFIGKIITRDGQISAIDTTDVVSIRGLQKPIIAFGQSLVAKHRHGGSGAYDPEKIVLRTDKRKTILQTASEGYFTYQILYSDPTSVELGHKHYYFIDNDGNGYTVNIVGSVNTHFHEITAYTVGTPQVMDTELGIADHTHTLTLSATNPDTWTDDADEYQIFINDETYYGAKATASASDKLITFSGDVTVVKRRFSLYKKFSDGSIYQFDSEEPSIYRFMLRVALNYYSVNADAIAAGTKQPLILPKAETPVTLLKNQCSVAEMMMSKAGDTFTFMGEVAPDPVTVTLVTPGHIDKVDIEIIANSEVTGKLRSQNVLYIPAEKFTTGVFEVGRIPILSHMGRYLESCEFESTRANSYDGYVWEITDTVPWGNVKIVHSAHIDSSGNYLIGTSDGLYRYPVTGAYLFIINGEKIVMAYGDLKTQLTEAARQYASKTGETIVITDKTYDPQIVAAEGVLTDYGTSYKMTGEYKISGDTVTFDEVNVFYVDGYKILNYGYETVRLETEVLQDEEIVDLAPGQKEAEAAAKEADPTAEFVKSYIVKNDFNKSTVKKILVESNYTGQYGGLDMVYFCLAPNYISKSTDPDVYWSLTYQSSLMGYISDIFRTYAGHYVAITNSGLYVCPSVTSSEYRLIDLPTYDSTILSATYGYDDLLIMSQKDGVYYTADYGATWTVCSVSDSVVKKLFFDPTSDVTSIVDSHYHDLDLDYAGSGTTSGMYNPVGVAIPVTHQHTVVSGVVGVSDGHIHVGKRTFYALDEIGYIYESEDGIAWSQYSQLPTNHGESGLLFACFGDLFLNTLETVLKTSDGVTWSLVSGFDSNIYSAQWDDQNSMVYFGGVNELYSYDGTTVEKVLELFGTGMPSVYVDDVRRRFGFTVNNYKRKVEFLGQDMSSYNIDITYVFDECYPIHGPWTSGVSYDLYVNDKLIKSTRDAFYITGTMKADVSPAGTINFLVQTSLASDLVYGSSTIIVKDASDFPETGYLRVVWPGDYYTNCVFFQYTAKSANTLYLYEPSQYAIDTSDDLIVKCMSGLGEDDNILITVYEGKLINVGINTHEEIEDALSTENMGTGKRFADVHFSNLMHLTVALKYAIGGIGDDFKNYFVTIFDYNDIPGDPNNIERYIDIPTSDLYSQILHASNFSRSISTAINRVVFGFGSFANMMFVASDVGLFVMKTDTGYEGNWYRVDVDGSSRAHDALQFKSGQLLVCTEKGMYKNDDVTISSWTQYNMNVLGGIPTKITPRWADVGIYNNAQDYWWQGWQGITHTNESLVNSLLISGVGFVSVTDDYGGVWQKSYLKNSNGTLISGNYLMTDPGLLHNGTVLSCLKDLDNNRSLVLRSTGNGSKWDGAFEFVAYNAKVTGYTLTLDGNVSLEVTYSGSVPPTGRLRGLTLYLNKKEFEIIENTQAGIIVYGSSVVDSITGTDSDVATISPATLNVVAELPESNVLLGTSNGILTDRGAYLNSGNAASGVVKGVGIKATVQSLNITGVIKALVFQTADRSLISVSLDKIVKKNRLAGYALKFDGFSDMTVVSNEASKVDGLTDLVVTCDWTSISSGLAFSAIAENNVIYVEFDSYVAAGDLNGGKLFMEPEVTDNTVISSSVLSLDVVSNGVDYIELKKSADATSGSASSEDINWKTLFVPGAVVYSTLSDKTIPLYVDFSERPSTGALRGNKMRFVNVSQNMTEMQVTISNNGEKIVYVPYHFAAKLTTSGVVENEYKDFIVYSAVFEGNDFNLVDASFESDEEFNSRKTSVESDHYHEISLHGKDITGTIASLGISTSTYIDINITGTTVLGAEPFLSNPTLLAGQTMVAYNSDHYSHMYTLTIVSTGATYVRVKNDQNVFNTSNTEPKKVSAGFSFLIDAARYGVSSTTKYTSNFIVEKGYLTSTTYLKGTTINVVSSLGLVAGVTIVLRDRDGLEFRTTVVSTPSPTTFVIADQVPFDLDVLKNAYYELLFTVLTIGNYNLTATLDLGYDVAQIADTSTLLAGDSVVFVDNKGLLFSSKVSTVLSPTTFQTEDVSNSAFTIANEAFVIVRRDNYSEYHSHIIKGGEFTRVSDTDWYSRGYNYYHGHVISPWLKEVSDIEVMYGKTYVVGNDSKIYVSSDSGHSWIREMDFESMKEFTPVPAVIQKICTNGHDIVLGTNSGYLIYFSTTVPTGIVPLDYPVG